MHTHTTSDSVSKLNPVIHKVWWATNTHISQKLANTTTDSTTSQAIITDNFIKSIHVNKIQYTYITKQVFVHISRSSSEYGVGNMWNCGMQNGGQSVE